MARGPAGSHLSVKCVCEAPAAAATCENEKEASNEISCLLQTLLRGETEFSGFFLNFFGFQIEYCCNVVNVVIDIPTFTISTVFLLLHKHEYALVLKETQQGCNCTS